jgi:hypothetical protein
LSGGSPAAAEPRRGGLIEARRALAKVHPANLLASGAVLVSGGLLLHWLSLLTFWRDEWEFLLHRRAWSPSAILDPWVEELLAIPILIYKALLATFGMDSPAPFQLVAVLLFLLSVVLLFIYARRRIGEWLALASILPILFLGEAWDDLLFPFQMSLFGSISCGIGALLALERRDRAGDLAAMSLLLGSLFFFDLGIAFVAAVTLEVALDRDRFRRAYVVVVPTLLWLLWYAGWGHTAQTNISLQNFANLPSYVVNGLATSLGSLLGLGANLGDYQTSPLDWGRPLLVLAVLLGAWRIRGLGRPSHRLLAVLALLLGFWSLTALNASPLAPPTAGRYQYIGVILLVLVAAELAVGLRAGRWAIVGILAVAGAAALSNVYQLRSFAHTLQGFSEQERGGLAALEIDRGQVDPGFQLTEQNSGVDYLGLLDAGSYLSAVDAYGSPAYSIAQLASAPEVARVAADKVFAAALSPGLAPAKGTRASGCTISRLAGGPAVLPIPPTGLTLQAQRGPVQASLRRYASQSFPVALGPLAGSQRQLLKIPADRATQPWTLELAGRGAVTVCRAGGT